MAISVRLIYLLCCAKFSLVRKEFFSAILPNSPTCFYIQPSGEKTPVGRGRQNSFELIWGKKLSSLSSLAQLSSVIERVKLNTCQREGLIGLSNCHLAVNYRLSVQLNYLTLGCT